MLPCVVTTDDPKSAPFINIGGSRIAMTELYLHPVEAVQGRTAWTRRSATLRRQRISSPRRAIRATGPSRLSSTGSSPSTIRDFGIDARPRAGRCPATWKPVRGLSQVRPARARLSAGQVRCLPGGETRGVLVQAPRLLSELRRPADDRDGGTPGGPRLPGAARPPVGAVATLRACGTCWRHGPRSSRRCSVSSTGRFQGT